MPLAWQTFGGKKKTISGHWNIKLNYKSVIILNPIINCIKLHSMMKTHQKDRDLQVALLLNNKLEFPRYCLFLREIPARAGRAVFCADKHSQWTALRPTLVSLFLLFWNFHLLIVLQKVPLQATANRRQPAGVSPLLTLYVFCRPNAAPLSNITANTA